MEDCDVRHRPWANETNHTGCGNQPSNEIAFT